MEFETTETVRSTPSRYEKSLGLLTMKFVSLLQEAKDGVLDLKVVSGSVSRFGGGWSNFVQRDLPGSRCEQRAVSQTWGQSGAMIVSRWIS